MSKAIILNGPYLLAPTTNSMTIVWETRVQIETNVFYGVNERFDQKSEIEVQRATPYKDNPDGNFIYTSIIKKLDADTKYSYKIKFRDEQEVCGEFKTLGDNPDVKRIYTISDSHLFYTNRQFTNTVIANKPDFIIHIGDISFGTGYQREQYEDNWFKKIPEVIKTIPVIHVPGNHDDGPFYNDFFTFPQSKTYQCDKAKRSFSFDYGKIHFLILDSNPWGLFEMNAINSGLTADSETKKKIYDTLEWAVDDLKSNQAKSADWRVIVLHHPYTDEFNNKYIVPIAEKYNVNLVMSGHLHYYVKSVSINPEIGAKTVYLTQGTAQDGEHEFNPGQSDKRLLVEFPEVIALGKGNYGKLDITKSNLTYKNYGFNKDDDQEILVDTVVLTKEKPEIIISDVQIDTIDKFGHIRISGKAKNAGSGFEGVIVKVNDNGAEHVINLFGNKGKERIIALNCNEEKDFIALYETTDPGQHELYVEGITKSITVCEPEQLTFEHMKFKVGNEKNTNLLIASVEITNNLKNEVQVPVDLIINEEVVQRKTISLAGYEKKNIEYYHKLSRGGSYKVKIANLEEKEIRVQGPVRIIPRVKDLSGNGNDALLHGTPRVVKEKDGVIVHLDQYSDYLEIPDSDSLRVSDGFTGMVWANISRLAQGAEMSHNPLMVKGKSIGWGATYLLRMAVERAGSLKWGTCHDITEYAWQGGNASLNEWVQYTSSFDKKSGGTSYCNTNKVAEISGIGDDARLRNWEQEPLFVGYSYIGHVIKEIARPKYFTHLPAQISQVRFYRTKLSSQENQFIYKNPAEIGPKSDELAVWLDFNNIITTGTHITEWRRPAIFEPSYKTEKKYWNFNQLKVSAVIPDATTLEATVEVSDDGDLVKDSKKICIHDGVCCVDLSNLQQAQYIRIVTKFVAEVGDKGTFTPELWEYQVTASTENTFTEMIWATRDDWEKGRMTEAVGFEPVDRLKTFHEYTDVIHG